MTITGIEFDTLAAIALAQRHIRHSNPMGAVQVLERRLEEYDLDESSRYSLRVVMRPATLYRFLERYPDELALLERFLEIHPHDRQRTRIDARISKVTALIAGARTSSRVPVNVTIRSSRRMTSLEKKLLLLAA